MARVLLACCLASAVVGHGLAQVPASEATRLEVASVKPNKAHEGPPVLQSQDGGRVTATNLTPDVLIRDAYHVRSEQLLGGPAWLTTESFDIEARASGSGTNRLDGEPFASALKQLLAERFKLVAHSERRARPVYALVAAKSDGKPGPGIKQRTSPCEVNDQCGASRSTQGMIVGNGVTVSNLINALSPFVGRMVVDHTQLRGIFDVRLQWAAGSDASLATDSSVSIFTAVQDQLGLKLESATEAVDVLVIDHVERPTEN